MIYAKNIRIKVLFSQSSQQVVYGRVYLDLDMRAMKAVRTERLKESAAYSYLDIFV